MTLKSFPTIGDKKIDSIIWQLLKSKNNDLWRIINALWIRHIGKKTAQLIVGEIAKSIENDDELGGHVESASLQWVDVLLQKLSDEQLLWSIHGIGVKMIESLVDFAKSDIWKNTFAQLTVYWVILNKRSFATTVTGPLNGVRFCVTGTFEISRADISQQLVKLGGEFCENITKNVTHLIVWQDASSKVAKAEKNGIQIINGLQEAEKLWWIAFEKKGVQGGLF
jgi:DNA ligase (NAD+)